MIRAVVTDIEGTTSSLSFVKDTLFPYARAHLREFVHDRGDSPEVRTLLADARREAGGNLTDDELLEVLDQWMADDKKITPLKSLQGLIWHDGYRKGAFTGHVYADAAANLKTWHERGIALYVYSSGSVPAQKLLFGHTGHGDLTPLFSGYFDTRIGAKKDAASYRRIIEAIGHPADRVLFLSDSADELEAARAAGLQVLGLCRDEAACPGDERNYVDSFDAVALRLPLLP